MPRTKGQNKAAIVQREIQETMQITLSSLFMELKHQHLLLKHLQQRRPEYLGDLVDNVADTSDRIAELVEIISSYR